MTARTYRIHGRVQGVGFRYFVIRLGRACGVRGAVRNELDGSVTAVAEGEEEALARFGTGLESGPPAARVASVETTEAAARPATAGFDAVF